MRLRTFTCPVLNLPIYHTHYATSACISSFHARLPLRPRDNTSTSHPTTEKYNKIITLPEGKMADKSRANRHSEFTTFPLPPPYTPRVKSALNASAPSVKLSNLVGSGGWWYRWGRRIAEVLDDRPRDDLLGILLRVSQFFLHSLSSETQTLCAVRSTLYDRYDLVDDNHFLLLPPPAQYLFIFISSRAPNEPDQS